MNKSVRLWRPVGWKPTEWKSNGWRSLNVSARNLSFDGQLNRWKPNKWGNAKSFSSYSKELIENLDQTTANNLNGVETVIKYTVGLPFFIFGITSVKKNHVIIPFRFGKPDGYFTEGLTYIYPSFSRVMFFCGDRTINNNDMQLTDSNKNPIVL